jgi:hypothetical protein
MLGRKLLGNWAVGGIVMALGWPSTPAAAAPTVVWLEPAVPGEKALARSNKLAGPTSHVAWEELAFPAEPPGAGDDEAYNQLRERLASARARWDDFEVEFTIANELREALEAIRVIRDGRDADAVVSAEIFEGAAVARAFDAQDFQAGVRAEPFRWTHDGAAEVFNAPWMHAIAIDSDHRITQLEAEAATWTALQSMQEQIEALPDGRLSLTNLPSGALAVIDGVAVPAGKSEVSLRPGRHFVHVLRNGNISGRGRIEVLPGRSLAFPERIGRDALGKAHASFVGGDEPTDALGKALDPLVASGDPIFLAALDDGRVRLRPFANGAALLEQVAVTGMTFGEIGPEIVVSPLFDGSAGSRTTAPALTAGMGFEFGVYNGVILGGLDLAVTPLESVTFANRAHDGNLTFGALPRAWGGVGAYILRPVAKKPTLLLAGTYGWNGPAHVAAGARLVLGVPSNVTNRWVQFSLGATTAAQSEWDATGATATPMQTFYLRIGLGQRL